MNIRHIKAIIVKESFQIIRDPSAILLAFFMPILLLYIFGYSVNLDSNQVKVGVVMESSSNAAKSLAKAFDDSKFLEVSFAHDRRALYSKLVNTSLRGIIVIPQNFDTLPYKIQVITDGSEPNTAQFVTNYARGVGQIWTHHQDRQDGIVEQFEPINPVARYWYNPELKSRNFLIPGSIAIVMTLIGTLLTSLVISREWERGTMEALMSTPISMFDILFGKLITYYILGMASMLICTVIAHFYYMIPFYGTLVALAVLTTVFLLTALSTGLLISTLSKNQFLASQIALMTAFLPAFMLSGFIFEIASMPAPLRAFTYVISAKYFVSSLQTIFLVGNVWPLLWKALICMSIIAIVLLTITLLKTRKRLD